MTRNEIFRNNYKYQAEESEKEQKNSNQEPSEIERNTGKVEYFSIFKSEEEEKLFVESCELAKKKLELEFEQINDGNEER